MVEYNLFNTPDDEKIDFEAETEQEFIKELETSFLFKT